MVHVKRDLRGETKTTREIARIDQPKAVLRQRPVDESGSTCQSGPIRFRKEIFVDAKELGMAIADKSHALNKYSSRITQPKSQGASQAMLYGTGLTEADMNKAQVGIASVWYEGNTCNMHLNKLAEKV